MSYLFKDVMFIPEIFLPTNLVIATKYVCIICSTHGIKQNAVF
jgi:hypothetical protein